MLLISHNSQKTLLKETWLRSTCTDQSQKIATMTGIKTCADTGLRALQRIIEFELIQSGTLECFLGGRASRFVVRLSRALMSFGRVSEGSMTSSM